MSEWHVACKLAEVTEDAPYSATVAGVPVGIFRIGDRCFALHDVCTHEYARLSRGYVEGGTIECPLHEAKFDIRTGRALCAPAAGDVACYAVRIDGDQVLVQLADP